MTFFRWSKTAAADSNADPTINWSEGQSPSSVNDSARAMMAAAAKYRDDISGALVTTGTSAAYVVASNQVFDTVANMDGKAIAFSPHVANVDSPTLTVDGLGPFPIKNTPALATPAGTLLLGTPYVVVFNNAASAFYLVGLTNSPYLIPLGATLDFWLPTAPNSSFVFPYGQAISRTTYAALYALMGTTFGTGDGITTFNIPDLRGRVVASPDNMGGGADPARLSGSPSLSPVRNSIGSASAGGESAHTLTPAQIPSILSSTGGGIPITVNSTASNVVVGNPQVINLAGASSPIVAFPNNGTTNSGTLTSTGTTPNINSASSNTGGQAHENMPPTILGNRIMRVL